MLSEIDAFYELWHIADIADIILHNEDKWRRNTLTNFVQKISGTAL